MKKYRLKEEVKKYFDKSIGLHEPRELKIFENSGITLEALEEVPERIELGYFMPSKENRFGAYLAKMTDEVFTDQEKDLCEKALNGELLDVDSLDDEDFKLFYYNRSNKCTIETNPYVSGDNWTRGIKAVLKQYLNEKK